MSRSMAWLGSRMALDDMMRKRMRPDSWVPPAGGHIPPPTMGIPGAFAMAQPAPPSGFAINGIPGLPAPEGADGAFVTGVKKAKQSSSAISFKLITSKLDNEEEEDEQVQQRCSKCSKCSKCSTRRK